MQFAGQRTDMDLKPLGEPYNYLIKLTEDVLPDPDAILLTGITPQQTLADGLSEAEFLEVFTTDIVTPDTIFVGYNSIRFDDEFMRYLQWRNFYDAYEWQWQDGRSRWDLLDAVRMTRALRPEGINGRLIRRVSNKLGLLTSLNGLDHANAHDALSDVQATIALAQLLKAKQPKLFEWLLQLRSKKAVKDFLSKHKTFIYTSGKYDSEAEKTAVVRLLDLGDDVQGALVYDLRQDPTEFKNLSPDELIRRWQYTNDPEAPKRLPVKTLKYNHSPAVSPPRPLTDEAVQKRLHISLDMVNANLAKLHGMPELVKNIIKARDQKDEQRAVQTGLIQDDQGVDEQLYDGFVATATERK